MVSFFVLIALPFGFVTVIGPVFALAGMVSVILVPETILNVVAMPLIVTDVAPVKFVPVSVTFAPLFALSGVARAIVGTGALSGRNPCLSMVAWPYLLSTWLTNACAAAWFGLLVTTPIA